MDNYILRHITSFQNGLNPKLKLSAKLFIFNIFPDAHKTTLIIIKYFHINNLLKIVNFDYGIDYDEYTFTERLICSGDLNTLKWLHENTNIVIEKGLIDTAVAYGRLKVAKWIRENFE